MLQNYWAKQSYILNFYYLQVFSPRSTTIFLSNTYIHGSLQQLFYFLRVRLDMVSSSTLKAKKEEAKADNSAKVRLNIFILWISGLYFSKCCSHSWKYFCQNKNASVTCQVVLCYLLIMDYVAKFQMLRVNS